MTEFFENVLNVANDGQLSINETILIAITAVIILLIIALISKPIIKAISNALPGRKKTIFSHRKNQYKTKVGKKNKTPKKKK